MALVDFIAIEVNRFERAANTALLGANDAGEQLTSYGRTFRGEIKPQPTLKAWKIIRSFHDQRIIRHVQAQLRDTWKKAAVFLVKGKHREGRQLYFQYELINSEGGPTVFAKCNRDAGRAYMVAKLTFRVLGLVAGNEKFTTENGKNIFSSKGFKAIMGYRRRHKRGRHRKHRGHHKRRHGKRHRRGHKKRGGRKHRGRGRNHGHHRRPHHNFKRHRR